MFDNLDGTNLQYTIRPVHEVEGEEDSTWDTDIAQPRFQEPGPRFSPKYVNVHCCMVCTNWCICIQLQNNIVHQLSLLYFCAVTPLCSHLACCICVRVLLLHDYDDGFFSIYGCVCHVPCTWTPVYYSGVKIQHRHFFFYGSISSP